MGFIPETVTKRLPSSLVGTLGVDTSGEKLGIAVAKAGEKVFGAVAQKAAERKRTLDIISAQAKIRQFESEMDGATTGIKGTFKDEPQGGVEQTFSAGEQLIDATLGDIKDDSVRAMVAQGTTSSLRRSGNQMKSWAHQQEVINGARDYSQVTNFNAEQLSKKPDIDLMEQMIAFELGREDLAKGLYGKNWPTAVKQSVQATYKGYITGLELTDPKTGVRFLEEYDFKGAFSPSEMKKFKEDMQDSFVGWEKDQLVKDEIEALSTFDEIHKRDKDRTLDVEFIDQTKLQLEASGLLTPERERLLDISRKSIARRVDIHSTESEETLTNLYDSWRNLGVASDKKTAEASLKELFAFRLDVVQAEADGKIKDTNKMFFLDQIITPSNSKLLEGEMTPTEFDANKQLTAFGVKIPFTGNVMTPEYKTYDKVISWLDKLNFEGKDREGAMVRILRDAYIEMADLRGRGSVLSSESAEVIAERKIRDEMARQRADLEYIPPKGTSYRDPVTGELFTLLPNGTKIPIEKK